MGLVKTVLYYVFVAVCCVFSFVLGVWVVVVV